MKMRLLRIVLSSSFEAVLEAEDSMTSSDEDDEPIKDSFPLNYVPIGIAYSTIK